VVVERPALPDRPSYEPRMQMFSMATVIGAVRDTRDREAIEVAEWFMARARRGFREALWADDARFGGAEW
jgi:hypothetical protein